MKLVFPRIIPIELTSKLLVLDTDITVVNDIYELWSLFKYFNKKQAIGIVENQSNYYTERSQHYNPWPAIGRGFNSGVLLYNLLVLKRMEWPKLWSEVTKRTTLVYGPTRLADQDIINAVLKENPEMLFEVPCYWNTQLSDRTLSQSCYKQHVVKIIHWNSPKKYNVHNKDGDYFRNVASGFMEYNGNLLRKQLLFCNKAQAVATNHSEELCSEFHRLLSTSWRTLLFFREYKHSVSVNDVTFVAQLSYDRLQTIEELVKCWPGPISLTLYVSDPELEKSISFISSSDILQQRSNVAYHAVFKDGDFYPINMLRNVGLRQVQTPYVFLADIDFLPNKNLYEMLIKHLFSMAFMENKALVVPAFEIQSYGNLIPRNKKQLLKGLKNKSVVPFLSSIWSLGHAPTNYEKWKTADEPYKVMWEPDYEPYVVVRRDVVEYDERFLGFGWNKVSHIMELEA
uniref:Glycosyltransferase-like protein n=2 Tax=Anoplophora glabripennis TaxID=217634 RepID=V5I9H3_ANOGL